jgi:hypothetical protein
MAARLVRGPSGEVARDQARRFRVCLLIGAAPALLCLLYTAGALAQPAAAAPPPSADPPAPSADSPAPSAAPPAAPPPEDDGARAKAERDAKARLKSAKKLMDAKEYGAALAEYQAAFRLFPSWGARTGAGVCLVKLQRYDEAQETFEAAVRDHGDAMSAKARAQALQQIDIMRTVTGTINVTEAEIRALVVIDGRVRGEHPAAAPLSVLVGPHLVRVYKEGFTVYEKSVTVAKGQMETLSAKLTRLAPERSGRLRVGEVSGKKMEVVVDGVPVGMTPWEGPISAGEHSVVLRQPPEPPRLVCGEPVITEQTRLAATEEPLATTPIRVTVKPQGTTPLSLKAEPLNASVRVALTPATAALTIDGIEVARGGYVGRLAPGKHVIKAEADGFFPETQEINVPAGEDQTVRLAMRKDHNAPLWAEPPRFLIELGGSAPISPSFGGEIAASCGGRCEQSLGVGGRFVLRGGYELGNGFGFGLTAGYLGMQQSTAGRAASFTRDDAGPINGVASDVITLKNVMVGAYAGLRLGKTFPVRVGVSAGAALGSISDERTGLFGDSPAGPVTQSGFFAWAFVEPEIRVGLRISEHMGLGISLSGLLLMSPRVPTWLGEMDVGTKNDVIGSFESETVTSSSIFAITEGLYLTYEL